MSMNQFNNVVLDYAKCGDRGCGDNCCQVELDNTARDNKESETITLQPSMIDDKPVRLVNGEDETTAQMATRMLARMRSKQMEVGDTVVEMSRDTNSSRTLERTMML